MRTVAPRQPIDEQVFSAAEIAEAAGVSVSRVAGLLNTGASVGRTPYVERKEAIRLVRLLISSCRLPGTRPPITLLPHAKRRQGVPLAVSTTMHLGFLLLLVFATSGLFASHETEQEVKEATPIRLVYFMIAGPGGGGGGGGMKLPDLPARAERKAPVKVAKKLSSPITRAPKPRPVEPPKPVEEPPKIDPPKIDPPKPEPPKVDPPKPAPPQTVQAPVAPIPADSETKAGVLNQPPGRQSAGPGTGGGAGTGTGTGMGEGTGAGIGPGSGGGTGGGPYRPGSGIEPPTLLREVKPLYTEEARKRALEGSVLLEIVVRRDGSVGNVRLTKRLGEGLDERAVDAVRQWRFSPARRLGAPVDVVVEVSVEFKLR
jgi:TonB family protein